MTLDLVGQDHVRIVLEAALAADKPPKCWVVTGPPGTGKSTIASFLAEELDLVRFDPWTPEENAQRKLLQKMQTGRAAVVLVARHASDVAPEIRARSIVLTLLPIPEDTIVSALGDDVPEDVRRAIAERSNGSLAEARARLDQLTLAGAPTMDGYRKLFGTPNLAGALLDALSNGDVQRALAIVEDYARLSPEPRVLVDDAIGLLTERLADDRYEPRSCVDGIRALWSVRQALGEPTVPTRAALAVVLAELATVFYQERRNPGDVPEAGIVPGSTPESLLEALGTLHT